MPSKRDFLKATAGLVLATGGSWLAAHARGAVRNAQQRAARPAGTVDAAKPAEPSTASYGEPRAETTNRRSRLR
jgi:hypothetical protein